MSKQTKKGQKEAPLSFEQVEDAQDIEQMELFVPEWGGSVLMKPWSTNDSLNFAEMFQKNQKQAVLHIVASSVINPDGSRMFASKAQIETLGGKSLKAVRRISNFAMQLNGISSDNAQLAALLRERAEKEEDRNVKARLLEIAEETEGGDEGEG